MKMLEGIKVLDFTINAAGPIVGAYFADYGAEVVKIEPPGGEAGRRFAYYVGGMSTYACGKDRGKKSIEMNLKDPEAIALIKKILPEYDVVLQSFKPGRDGKAGARLRGPQGDKARHHLLQPHRLRLQAQ